MTIFGFARSEGWRPRAAAVLAMVGTVALLAGCADKSASGGASLSEGTTTAASSDDLLPVDCLLPGQIRQLGQAATYVSRPRSIKTSASDCRVRGGEYVAYDRADYATALKVWLPRAQEGDKEAQTYVGDIYQKGMGLAPDYTLATAWYQKAADQGYAPAQINLGLMYERGLGVPRDPQRALDWYRRASGLPEGELQLASASAADDGRIGDLQQALDRQTAQSQELRTRNEQLEQELASSRSELARRQQQASEERQGLGSAREDVAKQQAALESQRRALQEQSERLRRIERERERLAAERDRLAAQLEASRTQPPPQPQQPATPPPPPPAPSQADLDRLQAVRQQAAAAQAEAEKARAALASQQAQIERSQSDLAARQAEVQRKQQEAARLDAEIAGLRQESDRRRAELAKIEKQATAVAALGPPVIEMIDPQLPKMRGTTELKLRGGVTQRTIVGRVTAPAGLASLVINDAQTQPSAEGLFRAEVPVSPSGTDVSIVAVDRQGKRADVSFRLKPDDTVVASRGLTGEPDRPAADQLAPGLDFGSYYALVIGNNQYQHLPKLETAVADAQAISQLLGSRFGFRTTTLLNANRYQILSELNKMRERLTEKDNLVIYYAGHGELDRVNQRGNWLPVDAEPDSTANWIPNVAVTDILNATSAKHILVIADSCYSGSLTRSALARLQSGMSAEARANWIKSMVGKPSRTALTSGGLKPVLDTVGGQHSVFAQAVLDVLSKQTGILDAQRLAQDVTRQVRDKARNVGVDQVPEYAPIQYAGHGGGEFFFVAAAAQAG